MCALACRTSDCSELRSTLNTRVFEVLLLRKFNSLTIQSGFPDPTDHTLFSFQRTAEVWRCLFRASQTKKHQGPTQLPEVPTKSCRGENLRRELRAVKGSRRDRAPRGGKIRSVEPAQSAFCRPSTGRRQPTAAARGLRPPRHRRAPPSGRPGVAPRCGK